MDTTFKKDLKKAVLVSIQKNTDDLNAQLIELQEASNADTKSSMGISTKPVGKVSTKAGDYWKNKGRY